MIRKLGLAAVCALCLSVAPAFAADKMGDTMGGMQDPMVGGHAMYANKTIVANALNSDDHTTLVAAVKAAGLVDTLKGPGPFTVFAPTDAAFAKLPPGTLDRLLKPENKAKLVKILTYHVVAGDIMSSAIAGTKTTVKTVEGQSLTVDATSGTVMVNDATVIKADVIASNGVIHVIDTVLMPKM